MSLHLLRLFEQLESHHTYGSEGEDNNGEDSHDPRPDTTTFSTMPMTMMILLRIRLRHAAP